jgi:hypothetical protein
MLRFVAVSAVARLPARAVLALPVLAQHARRSGSASHGDEHALAESSAPAGHESTITEVSVNGATATLHARSPFKYEGSTKGGEVGARNEAAYIPYAPTTPSVVAHPAAAFAMPHVVNLLTVAPLATALVALGALFWGVALWRFYASRHFVAVRIERPAALQAA